MSSLFSDDNIFDLLRDERGDIDVAKLVSKAEALAKKKKKEQQRLEKLIARNDTKISDGDLTTRKNLVVVYGHETDEQEEKRKVDYFYDNKEIDGKIVAQEKAEPRKEKEKNGEFVKDLEDKRRDLNNKKKMKNHKIDLKEKEEAGISAENKRSDAGNKRLVEEKKLKKGNKKEKEEDEGSTGVVEGLFLVLRKAVTVGVFMALGAVMDRVLVYCFIYLRV
ncbi:hypothetical protein D5086_023845 [Populus alba]|uniref:Uncharacterized protein n=3 Tax=Populus TaxID=3689 RepID=A0ACC4BAY5_POPAL|nr:hypothetical protein NC653_029929 [Populus alba x Populus x berolinensis]TKS04492.1 hypothetical protein D5086_0000142170 [Populus alba]